MELKIGQEIQGLLLEHGQLALPKLGTFVGEYQSATLDQLQGVIAPPQYRLRFDTNLQLDDGILTQHLRDKFQLSASQARAEVENYINDCRIAFESRELVVLPSVGRLYLDASHRIQFLADATNFNIETFALPPVRLVPITRAAEQQAVEKPTDKPAAQTVLEQVVEKKQHERQHGMLFENLFQAEPTAQPKPQLEPNIFNELPNPTTPPVSAPDAPQSTNLTNNLNEKLPEVGLFTPTLVVLVLLLLAFLIMYIYNSQQSVEIPRPIDEPQQQFNQPPPMPPADIPQPNDGTPNEPQRQRINNFETPLEQATDDEKNNAQMGNKTVLNTSKNLKTKGAKLPECIVVVGVFSEAANAQRAVRSVQDFGYSVYRDQVNGATRIGCRFSYESDQELNRRIGALRKKFGENARILKK